MNATFTIDDRKLRTQLLSLSMALKKDAGEVVRDETRLLLKQCIRFTPPKTAKQGREAIKRDINRAAIPLTEDAFEVDWLKKLARTGSPQDVRDALARMQGWKRWKVEEFTPELHQKAGDRRGRVQRGQRVLAYPAKAVNAYSKRKQRNTGRQRAGWTPAYMQLGGTVPAWVRRHRTGARGFVQDGTSNTNRPSITAGNTAAGVAGTEAKVRQAMRARSSAIGRRLRLIASGYSRDVSAGIRARSRARRTPSSFNAN